MVERRGEEGSKVINSYKYNDYILYFSYTVNYGKRIITLE